MPYVAIRASTGTHIRIKSAPPAAPEKQGVKANQHPHHALPFFPHAHKHKSGEREREREAKRREACVPQESKALPAHRRTQVRRFATQNRTEPRRRRGLLRTFFVGLSRVSSEGGSLSISALFSSDRQPATPPSSSSLPNHRKTVSGRFFGAAEASSVRCGGSSHAWTPYRGVILCVPRGI